MSARARRLFDLDGLEIFYTEDIERDVEYCVSSGEDFRLPEVRPVSSFPIYRERTPPGRSASSGTESARMDSNRTSAERRDPYGTTKTQTKRDGRATADSTEYASFNISMRKETHCINIFHLCSFFLVNRYIVDLVLRLTFA